jgi:DNA-binding NtrC family response regulator
MSDEKGKPKVLVVDDEQVVCQSIEKILQRKGYRVEKALSVADALDALEASDYGLIITDLMMPQAGGLDLLKSVRETQPDIPVLIITGYASIQSAVEATRLGASGYLPKPFTPEELEKSVEGVVIRGPWKKDATLEPQTDVIDVDMPFSAKEVEKATSAAYVEHLTRSDVTIAAKAAPAPAADYCSKGARACKRFINKGVCQQEECPIITAENKKAGKKAVIVTPHVFDPIDVDMPFSASEVAAMTSEAYVAALGRSDMPVTGHWGKFAPEGTRKVLVVDDEAVVVNSIRKALTRKGYAVEAAYNCHDALTNIYNEDYDLVLLDMKMSDGNGLELIPKIRKYRPNLRVVIVTGFASVDTAVDAIQSGATDYIPKPFTPDELYAVTDRALKTAVA